MPHHPGLRAGRGVSPSQICANLDTEKITSAQEEVEQLQLHVAQPRKQYDLCQERAQVRGGRSVEGKTPKSHGAVSLCPLSQARARNHFTQSFGARGSHNHPGPAIQTAPNPGLGAPGCTSKVLWSNVTSSLGSEPLSAPRTPLASS